MNVYETTLDDPLLLLRLAHSVQDVAFALRLDPARFFYVVQNAENGRYYKEFQIPKKKGGMRDISRPVRGLALAQDRFAEILRERYTKAVCEGVRWRGVVSHKRPISRTSEMDPQPRYKRLFSLDRLRSGARTIPVQLFRFQ